MSYKTSSGNVGVLFVFRVLRQFVKHQHLQLLLASDGQNMTESWCKEGEIISILCYRINYRRKAPWKRDNFLHTYKGRDLLLVVGYKSTSGWLWYTSIMRQVQCCILHLLLDILNVLWFGFFFPGKLAYCLWIWRFKCFWSCPYWRTNLPLTLASTPCGSLQQL